MKFVDTQVVFEEIPDEITLCVNISGCCFRCPECHSKHLWEDIGETLDDSSVDSLIDRNRGVSCICFMGHGPEDGWIEMADIARGVKERHPGIKVALFSGNETLPLDSLTVFDYVKTGPYIQESGPLNSPGTNQRMYRNNGGEWEDITGHYQTKK